MEQLLILNKEQDADDSTYKEVTDFSTIPVGSYTLKASIAESTNYNANEATCNFAVTKQPITVGVSMDGWTYGDTANTPRIIDGNNPGSGDVTYTYYTDAACTNKTTSADGAASDGAAPKNAGTYYVKATVAETDNYAAGSGTKAFTIEKKVIAIEWSGDSFTYNGKTQAPTAAATGLADGDICTITVIGGQKDTNVKAGNDKYTATATAVDNTNYTLPTTGTTHEFTITPAELTITWTDTELTYNGSEQAPTAKLNGVMEGDTCDVTVTGGKIDTNVKSQQGTYTAEAACSDKNYVVNEHDKTTEFTITPKSIEEAEIELTPGDQIHNGNQITQTVSRVTVDGKNLTEGSDYNVDDSSTLTAIDFDTYTITVKGVGNYKDTASVKWKIKDENPPTGELAIDQNKWEQFQPDATFGRFSRETQTVTIHASDDGSGVDKVYYYNSNEILSLDEVKALAEEKWTAIQNGDSYDIEAENKYVVYVKITDKSGNVTYISSDGFVIDKTAPEIIGVKDQGVYCEAVTLTAADANLDSVTVDGEAVSFSADGSYLLAADNKAHTIIAADKAGNTTTVQVTVYNGHSWKEPVFTWSADYTGATAVFTCANDASHEKTETCTVKTEVTKQATGAEKGEITVTATVTVDGKTYQSTKKKETMIAGSEEVGSNGGKITTEIIVSEDMPKTEINKLTVETAKSLLSQEEQTQVENGAEVIIYLEANSLDAGAVSKDDKSCVES